MTKAQKIAAIAAAGGIVAAVWIGSIIVGGGNSGGSNEPALDPEQHLLIATWNVRGYPETEQNRRDWFSAKLEEMGADVICVQEIANQDRVDTFVEEEVYPSAAFLNSSDGQDNAIFAAEWIEFDDIPDPNGFKHPVQAAYVAYQGFDAIDWPPPNLAYSRYCGVLNVGSSCSAKNLFIFHLAGTMNPPTPVAWPRCG